MYEVPTDDGGDISQLETVALRFLCTGLSVRDGPRVLGVRGSVTGEVRERYDC